MPPNLGDVTVRLRAETVGFERGVTKSQQKLKTLEKELGVLAGAFKKGQFSAKQYQAALRGARIEAERLGASHKGAVLRSISQAELGIVNARMASSRYASVLGVGPTSVAASTKKVAKASVKARQGLGTIRSSMASLVAMSSGVRGTFGTLASGMLQFASGNLVAIGVIAGIAGIIAVMKKLKGETKDTAEEFKGLVSTLREGVSGGRPNLGVGGLETRIAQVRLLRDARAERIKEGIRERFQVVQGRRGQGQRVATGVFELSKAAKTAAGDVVALNELLEDLGFALTAAEAKVEAVIEPVKVGFTAVEEMAFALRVFNEQQQRAAVAFRESAEKAAAARLAVNEMALAMQEFAREQQEAAVAAVDAARRLEEAQKRAARALLAFRIALIGTFASALGQIVRDTGNAMQALVRAVSQAMLLISARLALPGLGVAGAVLGGLFGAPHVGRKPVAATPVIAMNVNVSGAGNPLAMARDAQWQTALRESLLVANQGGFRI